MTQIIRSIDLEPPPDAADFKAAMRSLAGGVTVLTVGHGASLNGITVTSVSSFSAEPPTILVCVNRNASSYPTLVRSGTFGINIVAADQRSIAERFSGVGGLKGRDRFEGAEWRTGIAGAPLLVGAAASIDCTVDDVIERYSHAIVLGRVCSVTNNPDLGALAYRDGAYIVLPPTRDTVSVYNNLWY